MENIHKRAEEWCESIINRIDTSDLYRGYIQGAVEERAEFKEYLDKKRCEWKDGEDSYHHSIKARILSEIINELFEEE